MIKMTADRGLGLKLALFYRTYQTSIKMATKKSKVEAKIAFDLKVTKMYCAIQGRVVRKPVNANPGLKVNHRINFSSIKMFFASYVLYSLKLFQLTTKGQKTSPKTRVGTLSNPGLT